MSQNYSLDSLIQYQMQQIQGVIQAIAQGQDISQFDAKAISAAKQYSASRANELNRMINSTDLPPNVTREMVRNELDMYQGFADKIAENDPQYATIMDGIFIGAGLYAGAKYGPMALTKMRSMGQQGFGYAQQGAQAARGAVSNMGARAGAAASAGVGAAADFASRGMEAGAPYAQRAGQAVNRGVGAAAAGASRTAEYFSSPEFKNSYQNVAQNARTMGKHAGSAAQNMGQKTFGFASKALRRLFRIPF